MPKISHYNAGGLNLYLSEADRKHFPTSRVDVTVHKKSDGEFLRIHPNPHGQYAISAQSHCGSYPWRIQLPVVEGLTKFGSEPVEQRIVADGVISISKPTMTVPARGKGPSPAREKGVRNTRGAGFKRGPYKKRQAKPNGNGVIGLREAVEAINAAWESLGGDLEVTIDQENHRVRVRHLVEY